MNPQTSAKISIIKQWIWARICRAISSQLPTTKFRRKRKLSMISQFILSNKKKRINFKEIKKLKKLFQISTFSQTYTQISITSLTKMKRVTRILAETWTFKMIKNLIPSKKKPSWANNFLTIKQVKKDPASSQAASEKKRSRNILPHLTLSQTRHLYQKKHLHNFRITEFNPRKLNHSSINSKKQ